MVLGSLLNCVKQVHVFLLLVCLCYRQSCSHRPRYFFLSNTVGNRHAVSTLGLNPWRTNLLFIPLYVLKVDWNHPWGELPCFNNKTPGHSVDQINFASLTKVFTPGVLGWAGLRSPLSRLHDEPHQNSSVLRNGLNERRQLSYSHLRPVEPPRRTMEWKNFLMASVLASFPAVVTRCPNKNNFREKEGLGSQSQIMVHCPGNQSERTSKQLVTAHIQPRAGSNTCQL